MKKRLLWKILLAVGILPFIAVLATGIYAAITGFSGLAIMGPVQYGWQAFVDWVVLYSYLYWPTYILGIILIIVALRKLLR